MTHSHSLEDSLLPGFREPWPRPSPYPRRSPSPAPPVKASAVSPAGTSDELWLPEGVRMEHAVQVWNALGVFPRPMGVRPPQSLAGLMRAIVTLSPRWAPGFKGGVARAGRNVIGGFAAMNVNGEFLCCVWIGGSEKSVT